MAARTTSTAVAAILGDNYGYKADGTLPDLTVFINDASVVVDRVVLMAAAAISPITLTTAEQESIERWLAAHLYCHADPLYMSRSTQGASGGFQRGQAGKGFESTHYGMMAMDLDYSGSLKKINGLKRAGAFWMGKRKSQQIPYNQRS